MTATQAVLAIAIPAAIVLLILAVPAIRRRRAQHRRAVTAVAGWCDDRPVPDLSTPDAVAPLAARLSEAREDQRLTDWGAFDAYSQEMREVDRG